MTNFLVSKLFSWISLLTGQQPPTFPSPPARETWYSNPGGGLLIGIFVLLFSACFMWTTSSVFEYEEDNVTDLSRYQLVFNDSIEYSLENKREFGLGFGEETWSEVYFELSNSTTEFDWVFTYDGNGETTAHSPGVPVLSWLDPPGEIVPLVSALLALVALSILTWGVWKWFGWLGGVACLILIAFDPVAFHSCFFSTLDGTITALLVLACSAVAFGINRSDLTERVVWKFAFAGILLGATTLIQFQQSIWLVVFLVTWVGFLIAHLVQRKPLGLFAEGSLVFAIGLLVVATPWWMRNCKTTGQFKPLGNAIQTNLLGAYSDAALETDGDLNIRAVIKRRAKLLQSLDVEQMASPEQFTLLEQEEYLANIGVEEASVWASENPSKLSSLMVARLKNHLGFGKTFDRSQLISFHRWFAVLGIVGCFFCWKKLGRLVLPICVASILVTVLTWSDQGRLFIPLRPLLYATFAGGIASVVSRFKK